MSVIVIVIAFTILFVIWVAIGKSRRVATSKDRSPQLRGENDVKEKELQITLKFEDSNKTEGQFLVFDIETTGLPQDRDGRPEDFNNWPYIVQLAWLLFDEDGKVIEEKTYILKQTERIPYESIRIHGITDKMAEERGIDPQTVYSEFTDAMKRTKYLVAHNMDFDLPILKCELLRNNLGKLLPHKKTICTMKRGTRFCKLPRYSGGYKYPKLEELFKECFYSNYPYFSIVRENHEANIDAIITAKCFLNSKN